MKIAVSEIREMLGQPDDGMTDVPLKLRVWMGYIEMAADGIPLDTSDIHCWPAPPSRCRRCGSRCRCFAMTGGSGLPGRSTRHASRRGCNDAT